MNRAWILSSLLFTATAAAACGDGEPTTPDEEAPPVTDGCPDHVCRLVEDIQTSTTLKAENVYVIPRLKQLFVQPGATLTIEPGTQIRGEQGAVLVITRGAKIMAEGTKEKPIVFTSAQPAGERTPGFWGGLLVLGAAPININKLSTPASDEATFEAFTSAIPDGKFGGTDPDDGSGVIKYVRIEFAGFNFVADREFNNLTLAGVGRRTVIDFVQVHGGSDDGIELFGGTVDVRHIVSSQNQDDGFDTDNGWSGRAQFVIVQDVSHPPTLPEASNGYESDNHGTAASYDALPRTSPTVYNATLIGDHGYSGVASYAAVFRRGTSGRYANHLWYGFPRGIELRDTATKAQLDGGGLEIRSSILFGNDADATNLPAPQTSGDILERDYITADRGNIINVDPELPAEALSKTAPSFRPTAGSPALTGGATPPNDGFFDTSATFIGAIGTDDWTAGWTAYPQR
jgi:hypothetical protein